VLISTHSYELIADRGIGAEEVLVLQPAKEKTAVFVGKDNKQIRGLMQAGASAAEAVLPVTEPKNAIQLEFWE
jgi:hypothetical protein